MDVRNPGNLSDTRLSFPCVAWERHLLFLPIWECFPPTFGHCVVSGTFDVAVSSKLKNIRTISTSSVGVVIAVNPSGAVLCNTVALNELGTTVVIMRVNLVMDVQTNVDIQTHTLLTDLRSQFLVDVRGVEQPFVAVLA
mmetsp:Transcript_9404/g.23520  ORF Transcript_9404/g.23520 Transcript_9404/m.23520 type:complete len:139 (-) Transcript_9404:480-896(-)